MTDPPAALASLFAGVIGWLAWLWWRKSYRTGVIHTRWGREDRATQPVAYWLTISYIAAIWLVMGGCSIALMLIAFGIIDGQRVW